MHEVEFVLIGNHPCLDFVNTLLMKSGTKTDLLGDFSDLLSWLQKAELATDESALKAARWAETPNAATVLNRATQLRAELRAALPHIAEMVPETLISMVNTMLKPSAFSEEVLITDGRAQLMRTWSPQQPEDVLAPLAEITADLLTHAELSRIKPCEAPTCILWFLDTTKNGTRRWCSMAICGNREKAASYQRRLKA